MTSAAAKAELQAHFVRRFRSDPAAQTAFIEAVRRLTDEIRARGP